MKSIKERFNKTELKLVIAGLILRIIYFTANLIIGGNHIDEVMLTLNGKSLSENLTDICGERLPVYFDTWFIGGQSPLPTYVTALFVKLFGHSLFAIRLPALILGLASFFAFCLFVKELFGKSKYSTVIIALSCISPWLIFSGVYLLDCNFFGHFLAFALYFIVRAVNTEKIRYYCLSMLFFALGFYCYIASVFVIPVFIAVLFIILLVKKKVGIKETAVSFITLVIASMPFILFGLVATKVIPSFTLFGFSFSDMPYYVRDNSTAMSDGISGLVPNLALNFSMAALMLGFIDFSMGSLGLNIFQFANLGGGIFFFFGIIVMLTMVRKKNRKLSLVQGAVLVSSAVAFAVFIAFNNDPHFGIFYRYATLTYLMIPIEGVGITVLFSAIKRFEFKKLISIYLVLSFLLFNFQFLYLYPNTFPKHDILYGDDYYSCLERAEELSEDKIVIYEDNPEYAVRLSVYSRNYYMDSNIKFTDAKEEIYRRYVKLEKDVPLTEDNSIEIRNLQKNTVLSDDFCIVEKDKSDMLEYDSTYFVEKLGRWLVLYK